MSTLSESYTEEGLVRLDVNSSVLTIPRGRRGLGSIRIDVNEINRVSNRITEIGRQTPETLPDLIMDFNVAILQLSKAIAMTDMELKDAQAELKEAKSLALLDRTESLLEARKIKSTADSREAVINIDKDVVDQQRRVDILNVTSVYLRDVHHAIKMAYDGSKKICDVFVKMPSAPLYAGGE